MKTVETKVTKVIKVWAIPHSAYWRENHPSSIPFDFEVRTSKAWDDGAVLVHEEEITLTVPAGIDLLSATISTMEEAIRNIKKDAAEKVDGLQKQINDLLLLTYDVKKDATVVDIK